MSHLAIHTVFLMFMFFLMTNIASADELVRSATAADNGYDPLVNDAQIAQDSTATGDTLCAPASRSVIEARIEKSLKSMGIKNQATYGLFSFKYDLGMSEEQIDSFYKDVTSSFGFSMNNGDAQKIKSNESFIAYVQQGTTKVCQTASK